MSDLKTLSLFELISATPSERLVRFDEGMLAGDLFETMEMEFETTVTALADLSYRMEREALEQKAADGAIYVGFQRLSRFTPRVAGRYVRMAQAKNQVYVFGLRDMEPTHFHERLHYIELGTKDSLANEWFVVIDTPQYHSSLSALDLVGFDASDDINDRLFTGVQTRSESITRMLREALDRALQGIGFATGSE